MKETSGALDRFAFSSYASFTINLSIGMELTKEHFDQTLAGLVTKKDLENAVAPLVTRGQIEELARMTKHGFDDVLDRLDVRDRVERHEKALAEISRRLGLQLEV